MRSARRRAGAAARVAGVAVVAGLFVPASFAVAPAHAAAPLPQSIAAAPSPGGSDSPVAATGPDGLPTALVPVPIPPDRLPARKPVARPTPGATKAAAVPAAPHQHDLIADARLLAGSAMIGIAVGIMGIIVTSTGRRRRLAPAPARPARRYDDEHRTDVLPAVRPEPPGSPRVTPRTTRIGRPGHTAQRNDREPHGRLEHLFGDDSD